VANAAGITQELAAKAYDKARRSRLITKRYWNGNTSV